MAERLVYSIPETAEVFGVSANHIYELVARGEIPVLLLGRRKVIPKRAVDQLLDQAMAGFDPSTVLSLVRRESDINERGAA